MSSELDELLKLLEENKHVIGDEIEQFIHQFEIVTSSKCTHTYIIYWVYLNWKAVIGGSPIPRSVFFKRFKKYFSPASRDRVRRYYVSSRYFLLHPDEIAGAKEESRQERIWHAVKRGASLGAKKVNHDGRWRKAQAARLKNREKRGI